MPFINGDHLPIKTSFTWSDCKAGLRSFRANPAAVVPNRGTLKITGVAPLLRKGFKQEKLEWSFATENPLPNEGSIEVEFQGYV